MILIKHGIQVIMSKRTLSMMKIDSKSGGNEVIFLSFIALLALKKRYYKKDCSFMYFHKVIKAVINIKTF